MRELLSIAHNQEFAIDKGVSFKEAIEAMYKNKNGCIILLKEKKPVAILTESDVIKALQFHVDFNEKAYSYATKPIITALANRPIESAFDMVIQYNIRRIVLLDSNAEYAGVVLQEDLLDYLEEDVYRVDLKISDILKPNQKLIEINKESSLQDALELMYKAHIGSLLVTQKSACIGILTEKDILSASYKEADMKLAIEKCMSAPVIAIREDNLVVDAIERMKGGSIRRLVVVDEFGYPVGILTNKDILKHIKGNVAKMLEIKVRHAKETMELLPEAIIEIINVK
ncbi:MAG TPA: CBS domain-containing protein, partial [Nitratifractor sp.]|nr:CBS domain-containing protein [Nitratifractor sp.]